MGERWMPDIVGQRKRFRQVFVQCQRSGDSTSNLRDFNRVRQSVAEVIGIRSGEDLRLVFQPAKCPGVNDAVTGALEIVAIRMRQLRISAAARQCDRKTKMFQPVRKGGSHASATDAN